MKPREYVRKYNLKNTNKFNHEEFIADLTIDFKSNLEVLQEIKQLNYNRFKQCVKEIRDKFDNIFIKSVLKEVPESLWKYFYVTVVGKVKDELFGEYLKKKKEKHEENQREWKRHEAYFTMNDFVGSMFNNYFNFIFKSMDKKDSSCFDILDLTKEATKENVMNKFRELCMIYHPDKDGDASKFREIVEAKNKCLVYIG